MKNITKRYRSLVLVTGLAGVGSPAVALESLSDTDLSAIAGRDGLVLEVSADEISADSVNWVTDRGTPSESRLRMEGLSLQRVGLNGANPGVGDLRFTNSIDIGSDGVDTYMSFDAAWDRTRIQIDDMSVGSSTNSFGSTVIDSSGKLHLITQDGLFNTNSTNSSIRVELEDADIFYKQGTGNAPEVVLNNFDFLWYLAAGKVAIDEQGILIEGDVDFNMTFDLRYDAAPATPFAVDGTDAHGLRFGWTGGLTEAQMRLRSGGSWTSTDLVGTVPNQTYDQSAKSEGLNLAVRWNYQPSFRWVVGESDDYRTSLEFGNWTKLPGPGYGFDFPLIAVDAIAAGQGPGGLCWGANWSGPASSCQPKAVGQAQYLDLPVDDDALAIIMRDAKLRAYSSEVRLFEDMTPLTTGDALTETYQANWALIYTWGDIDANLFLYPGGDGTAVGMRADLLVTNQTFDTQDVDGDGNTLEQGFDWNNGTHFMIGDTDANLAIGFVHSSFLMAADDLYISLEPGAQGGMQLKSDQVRLAMRGQFAGGEIPDMNQLVEVTRLDVNLESDDFEFALYPEEAVEGGETLKYVGFRGFMNLANTNIANFSASTAGDASDDGSYISLAEPSRPETDIRFADIRGALAFQNGKIELAGTQETDSGIPELVIANDILVGRTAGATANELSIRRVELGNRNLGSIVVPGGQWHASLTLSPQQ